MLDDYGLVPRAASALFLQRAGAAEILIGRVIPHQLRMIEWSS
jgi:hypothetical protein